LVVISFYYILWDIPVLFIENNSNTEIGFHAIIESHIHTFGSSVIVESKLNCLRKHI